MSITISASIGFSVSSITRTVVQSLNKFTLCCITENMPLCAHNADGQNGSTGDSIGGRWQKWCVRECGSVPCGSQAEIWQHDLWMIPIIIHNFFPSAAELPAGLFLFACLFDGCCVALCDPQCPSHTDSHHHLSLFSLLLSVSFSISLTFWFLDLSLSRSAILFLSL